MGFTADLPSIEPKAPASSVIPTAGFRVPYVVGFTGEGEQRHHLMWTSSLSGLRLGYAPFSRRGDYSNGVLRLRQHQNRTGRPDFKTVNTRRQWACMERLQCQICARSAVDPYTGRIWWLLSALNDESFGGVYTNAPPTCLACIPEAISYCPHLRRNAAIFTVGACTPFGVRADVFEPLLPLITPVARNAIVTFNDDHLPHAVARELLVLLHDVRPAEVDQSSIRDRPSPNLSLPPSADMAIRHTHLQRS